jgi:hypothetical protein
MAPVWQRQERCACGSGSAGRTPGTPRTPLYGHYDLCAGSLLDHRSPVATGRQTTARGSEARSHEHRGGAPKGAGPRSQGDPDTLRTRVGPFAAARGVSQAPASFGAPLPSQRGRATRKRLCKSRAQHAAATRNRARATSHRGTLLHMETFAASAVPSLPARGGWPRSGRVGSSRW